MAGKWEGEWAARAQGALVGFAREHVALAGAGEDRQLLEQTLCFCAAVWNAMVLVEALKDPFALAGILSNIEAVEGGHKGPLQQMVWELCERKVREHPGCFWVYRHLHVVRDAGGELRVRCEVLRLGEWLATGEPLRVGLME